MVVGWWGSVENQTHLLDRHLALLPVRLGVVDVVGLVQVVTQQQGGRIGAVEARLSRFVHQDDGVVRIDPVDERERRRRR